MNEEKRVSDRKRNLIVLVMKYLINIGYIETATKLESESHISLEQFDAADNIDLYQIVIEFENFYDFKFGKLPKLVRKINCDAKGNSKVSSFPKIGTPTKSAT